MSKTDLFCSIRFDACRCVDRTSRAEETEPGGEYEDEVDLGWETHDNHVGVVEGEDELEPVIMTKKRQRKSQGSGNVFWGFCSQRFGLKLFAQSALPVKRGITSFGSMRDMSGSY